MSNNEETTLYTVLEDGTHGPIEASMIAAVPDSIVADADGVEQFLKTGEYDHFHLGEIKDSATVMTWMRIFFPNMQVEQDNDGQVIIYTGINE
jgi:hypothetical protein